MIKVLEVYGLMDYYQNVKFSHSWIILSQGRRYNWATIPKEKVSLVKSNSIRRSVVYRSHMKLERDRDRQMKSDVV
jgi:hypothetical protein